MNARHMLVVGVLASVGITTTACVPPQIDDAYCVVSPTTSPTTTAPTGICPKGTVTP